MERWNDGTWRGAKRWSAVVLLAIVPSFNLSAQVGHEPSQSPYHDIRRGGVGVITFGYLGGSRGGPGAGISDGPTGGPRHEAALCNARAAPVGTVHAQGTRVVGGSTNGKLSRQGGHHRHD